MRLAVIGTQSLIQLNAVPFQDNMLFPPTERKGDMAENQNGCESQSKTTGVNNFKAKSAQAIKNRWVQDALEDDDVREALKILRSHDKNQMDKLV